MQNRPEGNFRDLDGCPFSSASESINVKSTEGSLNACNSLLWDNLQINVRFLFFSAMEAKYIPCYHCGNKYEDMNIVVGPFFCGGEGNRFGVQLCAGDRK